VVSYPISSSPFFLSRSFLIAYAPPAAARSESPPSIGAAEGSSGKAGKPGGLWAFTVIVVITSRMNKPAIFIPNF